MSPLRAPPNEKFGARRGIYRGHRPVDEAHVVTTGPVIEMPQKAQKIMRQDVLAGTNSLADGPASEHTGAGKQVRAGLAGPQG